MSETATFVVQTSPRAYEMRSAPLPDIGPDDGLLALEGCGVCGTDVEVFEGVLGRAYPLVPGHEPFGRILKIGRNAEAKWQVGEGDRVAVHSTLTCGRCRTCRRGLRGCTAPEFADSSIYGFRSPDIPPSLWGGFSTHLYLAPEAILVPLPDKLSVPAASLFNVMSNGVDWVLAVGEMRPGMTVAVLGAGPRGIASVIAARAGGAAEIAITGLAADDSRLQLALEAGADHAIDVTDIEVVDTVLSKLRRPPESRRRLHPDVPGVCNRRRADGCSPGHGCAGRHEGAVRYGAHPGRHRLGKTAGAQGGRLPFARVHGAGYRVAPGRPGALRALR